MSHIPSHPILGIDIGRYELIVAFPPFTKTTGRKTLVTAPTLTINKKSPDWWRTLLQLVDEECIIAAESTGYHLLANLVFLLGTYRPLARVFQAQGSATATMRRSWVHGSVKSDKFDAIALCLIAQDIAQGRALPGVEEFDYMTSSRLASLRALVNVRARLSKERRRTLLRLRIFAHNLSPTFDIKLQAYLTWLNHGYTTPEEIVEAARHIEQFRLHPKTRASILQLAQALPPGVECDPVAVDQVRQHALQLRHIDKQLHDTETAITAIIEHPDLRDITERWRTMPAVSDHYIAAIHVASKGHADHMTRDEFSSCLGVNPVTIRTSKGDYTTMNKAAYKPARESLYLWALALLNPNLKDPNPVRDYIDRLYPDRLTSDKKTPDLMPKARMKLARILQAAACDPDGYQYKGIPRG